MLVISPTTRRVTVRTRGTTTLVPWSNKSSKPTAVMTTSTVAIRGISGSVRNAAVKGTDMENAYDARGNVYDGERGFDTVTWDADAECGFIWVNGRYVQIKMTWYQWQMIEALVIGWQHD